MSHERKAVQGPSRYVPFLRIVDDDEDRLDAVKDPDRQFVMITNTSGSGDETDHQAVRLDKSDARALRKFLNEFIGDLEDDDE